MRIAEVAPPWLAVPPKGYGGIEWVVSLLADGLAERGHDVTLFATGDSHTKAELDSIFPQAPGPAFINDILYDTLHSLHAFRDPSRFDLFHVHSPFSALAMAAAVDSPAVHTVHGAFTTEMRALFAAACDRVWFVAISDAQRRTMPELPYAGVVHNGIEVERYSFREDKEDFVLFLGRAAPEKGAHRAILAAREAGIPLRMAVKVVHLTEQDYWKEQVRPLLGSDVEVLNEIGDELKCELLSKARAVLFPIDWDEPFGLVMTEAMACGTPVIATPRGAVPEVISDGETGFIVSVEDYPSQAAAAIGRAAEIDPKACRRHVEQNFSKEVMVAGYERAFERVLSSGPDGGLVHAHEA
jgi:glycosyltransferase involved in cell wall biosynthesis